MMKITIQAAEQFKTTRLFSKLLLILLPILGHVPSYRMSPRVLPKDGKELSENKRAVRDFLNSLRFIHTNTHSHTFPCNRHKEHTCTILKSTPYAAGTLFKPPNINKCMFTQNAYWKQDITVQNDSTDRIAVRERKRQWDGVFAKSK